MATSALQPLSCTCCSACQSCLLSPAGWGWDPNSTVLTLQHAPGLRKPGRNIREHFLEHKNKIVRNHLEKDCQQWVWENERLKKVAYTWWREGKKEQERLQNKTLRTNTSYCKVLMEWITTRTKEIWKGWIWWKCPMCTDELFLVNRL